MEYCRNCKTKLERKIYSDGKLEKPSHFIKRKYCSWQCYRLMPISGETRKKMGTSHKANPVKYWLGKKQTKEMSLKKSIRHSGENNPMFGKVGANKGRKFSLETRYRMSEGLKKAHQEGRHPLYKGGITPINLAIRASIEYKLWRESIFKRDDYRCLDCGQRGGQLNADHIYPFSLYTRLRFDINNGQTLCVDCHKKTPTYGGRARKLQVTYA